MEAIGYAEWRHVFKLDPDRELSDEALDAVCMSGTDAIMVGGSSGVTFDNTIDLMSRVRRYALPCVLEVSSLEAAVPGFDGYLVPMVLNTDKPEWIVGNHIEGIKEYGSFVPWDMTAVEGYIILNAEATAAKLTGAQADLDEHEVVARVKLADKLLRLPIVYLEYSGAYGDMDLVRRAAAAATQARVFYGGGIDSAAKAAEAAKAVHTVVVGNVVYSDLQAALATVPAVKSADH
ncbi:heptaprenylglyceryl phosphate synthase [Paenibacillus thailandensis]|uniref:Heptaprenylglyceryl phosphate synthase n=1 Tax=Paenibacillus thailandensis TaxID=393250 RepID=A0ABW5R318_9BACL